MMLPGRSQNASRRACGRPLRFNLTALGLLVFGALALHAVAESAPLVGQKLNPVSGPRGKTMFTQLPPESSGVRTENKYADPHMTGSLFRQYNGGSIGTGVTIGDFDNDGKPDIFVVSKTESCRLFRNLGGFKFEDVTDKAGVGDQGDAAMIWKFGATFVDVNNDGWLDLYLCRFDAPNLLYINQGNGTFKEMARAYGLDVKDSSVMAAFCDYDRDGFLDLYLATNMLTGGGDDAGRRGYMFHNEGNGKFSNVTDKANVTLFTRSHSATWWDYDNDGWPDLYVAYDYGVPDSLYHNNRDGTFTDVSGRVVPHTSFSAMGSDYGDVNNDGLIDFIVGDMASAGHEQDQRMMADSRARLSERPDGAATVPKYPRNALLLNTGTGYVQEAAFLAGVAATEWTWSIRLVDLDNDGHLDLHVTNGFPYEPSVDVVKRQMSAENNAESIRIMTESPIRAEKNIALRNLGDLRFEDVSAAWGLDQHGVSFGAAFGDLDGDGALDIVYTNYRDGATVLRNDGATGHRVIFDLRGRATSLQVPGSSREPASNRFGVGATVRIESALGVQVSTLGLSRGYLSSSEPMLHFGLGEDTVIKRLTVTWPSGRVQTWENVPVDQRYVIDEPAGPAAPLSTAQKDDARSSGTMFKEVSHDFGLEVRAREAVVDEASLQRLVPLRFNRRGPGLAVGRDAIFVGGTTVEARRILRANDTVHFTVAGVADPGPGSPRPATPEPGAVNDGPLLAFDANGDGHDDLLVTMGGNALPAGMAEYQPQLYYGDGRGGLRSAGEDALPPLPINAGAVAAADFDRDGALDVFIGGRILSGQYPFAPQSALLQNHGGKFADVTDTLAPALREAGMITSALWSDADGDGWLDLLLTLEWGNVTYFHNNQGKGFEDWTEKSGFATAGTGWWTSLAAADFNGDGRPDYVAGNVGLNTQYHADAAHPALLYAGDFKGDGSTELVEAYYEGERIYPWRARRDLGAVFPFILKRFPQNNNYARATLGEIFGDAKLAKAQRFAATELRSGVLLSQSDGTYRFEALPRLAQIAPLQGIVAGDFDGDGHADVYAVQNSYAPIPALGRFHGGLSQLLRGDGHGHFAPVPPAESNLLVPGDAKALVVLDLDGDNWPDFVVSRNNDTTLAFRNQGATGRHSLQVNLQGPAGNPTAIGARISVEMADGSTQTAEVYAGSGYYSQSTAACFFGYTDANPPRQIRVRWPSGKTTQHPIPAGSTSLVLSNPL